MRRRIIPEGTLIPILGFVIFQFGLLIVVNRPTLTDYLRTSLTDSPTLDIIGTILMFGGGITVLVSIIQMVKSISNSVSGIVQAQCGETLREISGLKSSLSEELALMIKIAASNKMRTCKFCGAEISEDAAYCPVCNRSQV